MIIRSYSELQLLSSFKDRYEYLKLDGSVGVDTFGFDRILNQKFYTSAEWRQIRNYVIVRDNGCDLGILDREIHGKIIIHHLNVISQEDFKYQSKFLLVPEYLISTSLETHNAIHYGSYDTLPKETISRSPNDTCPWRH